MKPIQQRIALRGALVPTLLFCLMTIAGCGQPGSDQETSMPASLTAAEIAAVANQRIVFAHQSVGNDILNGVQALTQQQGQALPIVEASQAPQQWQGIAHFKVGENGKPEGKIEQFAATMNANAFADADVAMLKLCY